MKIDLKIDGKPLTENEKKRFQEMYEKVFTYLNYGGTDKRIKKENELQAYNIIALIFERDE